MNIQNLLNQDLLDQDLLDQLDLLDQYQSVTNTDSFVQQPAFTRAKLDQRQSPPLKTSYHDSGEPAGRRWTRRMDSDLLSQVEAGTRKQDWKVGNKTPEQCFSRLKNQRTRVNKSSEKAKTEWGSQKTLPKEKQSIECRLLALENGHKQKRGHKQEHSHKQEWTKDGLRVLLSCGLRRIPVNLLARDIFRTSEGALLNQLFRMYHNPDIAIRLYGKQLVIQHTKDILGSDRVAQLSYVGVEEVWKWKKVLESLDNTSKWMENVHKSFDWSRLAQLVEPSISDVIEISDELQLPFCRLVMGIIMQRDGSA